MAKHVIARVSVWMVLVCAVVGIGIPAQGTLIDGARAQQGLGSSAPPPTGIPVVVTVSPNPTGVAVTTTVSVVTAPNALCSLAIRLPDNSVVSSTFQPVGADASGNATFAVLPEYAWVGSDTAIVVCSLPPPFSGAGTGTVPFAVVPSALTPTATPVPTGQTQNERVAIQGPLPLVPGSTFSILGAGFQPGALVSFTAFTAGTVYTATVAGNGTFTIANVQVPYTQPPGPVTIFLLNSTNAADRVPLSFTVSPLNPALSLTTTSAAYGDPVGVNGTGFAGNEVVDVSIGTAALFTVKTDSTGSFSGTFRLPNTIPYGTFSVAARGEKTGSLAYTPLLITPVSPFGPTPTYTATATPVPPTETPGPPTATPTISPVPLGPTQSTFYFAEGSANAGTHDTLVMLNTSPVGANTTVLLVFPDGRVNTTSYLVPPRSRFTLDAGSLVPLGETGQPFSVKVTADQQLSVSREIDRAGHDGSLSNGTTSIVHFSYFAEGYTSRGFHETLALFNSVNANASVTLRLLPSNGKPPIVRAFIVGPLRRYTIDVNKLAPNQSVGAEVVSDVELSVERTLTFGKNGNGLTTVPGVDTPQNLWYFAEGSTTNGFSEFLTILNPSSAQASVIAAFYDPRGKPLGKRVLSVDPGTRATIDVGKAVHSSSVGAIVSSTVPVLVERSMYRGSLTGSSVIGTGAFGRSTLTSGYDFPSGDSSAGNAEFFLMLNPNRTPLAVQLVFYVAPGSTLPYTAVVPPNSRITLDVVKSVPGLPRGPHAVTLRSLDGSPFMAEQSLYQRNFATALLSLGVPRTPILAPLAP